jgi:hypothetical protein
MMQPVPVAEVMSGKEGAASIGARSVGARSIRSDGGASRRRTPNATPLSNPISDRVIDHRFGSPPPLGLARESSSRASNRRPSTSGQRHDRNAATVERDFAFVSGSPKMQAYRRSPPLTPLPDADDSGFISLGGPMLAVAEQKSSTSKLARRISTTPKFAPQRDLEVGDDRHQISNISLDEQQPRQSRSPRLQSSIAFGSPRLRPVVSDSTSRNDAAVRNNIISSNQRSDPNDDSSRFLNTPTTPRLLHSTSLKTLSPTSNAGGPPALLHAAIYTTSGSPRAEKSQQRRPPTRTLSTSDDKARDDEDEMKTSATSSPAEEAIFASWQSPEVELPKWILEHTRREGVKERWSMDL